jgi:hypothetical protein
MIGLVLVLALGGCGAPAQSPSPTVPAATPPTQVAPTTVSVATPAATGEANVPQAEGGVAHFRDRLATADSFALEVGSLPAPGTDQVYRAWLLGENGDVLDLGAVSIRPDGSAALEWDSPNGENLLSRYSRFQITLEPATGGVAPAGPLVMAGELQDETLTAARRLFVKNEGEPATPRDVAFALGLLVEGDIAVQHVQNAVNAAAIGSLPETRMHLEHVVNIIEGAAGPRFGDHDGNGTAENPGDGFGVIGYTTQVAELLPDNQAVGAAAADVKARSAAIQDKSLELLTLDDLTAISAQLAELKGLADQLGANSIAGLYQAAQDALGFPVTVAP